MEDCFKMKNITKNLFLVLIPFFLIYFSASCRANPISTNLILPDFLNIPYGSEKKIIRQAMKDRKAVELNRNEKYYSYFEGNQCFLEYSFNKSDKFYKGMASIPKQTFEDAILTFGTLSTKLIDKYGNNYASKVDSESAIFSWFFYSINNKKLNNITILITKNKLIREFSSLPLPSPTIENILVRNYITSPWFVMIVYNDNDLMPSEELNQSNNDI